MKRDEIMLNKVLLMGNLTRDPELRYTANGSPVCNLGLAVNNRRNEDEVLFIEVTCWAAQAESVASYMSKGRQVLVEGRLILRQWESQEGQKRSKIEVVADVVQFMGSPNGEASTNGQKPAKAESVEPATVSAGDDDDIPF
jgi:single-strand DNA-binding protein